MKSIVEEASSIIKAIEKGWQQAGHPKEFSIKVFEEPQKNFIGMTVRSAKIGIFFDEVAALKPESPAQKPIRQQQPKPTRQQPAAPVARKKPVAPEKEHVQKEPAAKARPAMPTIQPEAEPKQPQTIWSEPMAQDVQDWLKESLAFISVRPLPFSTDIQHFYFKIHFDKPIFEDRAREKQLFSSLATLLLQMLKNKYKRPLKGYKIILTTKTDNATSS